MADDTASTHAPLTSGSGQGNSSEGSSLSNLTAVGAPTPAYSLAQLPAWPAHWSRSQYESHLRRVYGITWVKLQLHPERGPVCHMPHTNQGKIERALSRVRISGAKPASRDDLNVLLREAGLPEGLRERAWRTWFETQEDVPSGLGYQASRPECAPAGRPWRSDPFRSEWERRLAAAFDRLGVKWSFEPDWFSYQDWGGQWHRYTPDFRLDDFKNVYVEVKGPNGADPTDDAKMRDTLRKYPNLTLLLWDASMVEYIEDLSSAAQIVPLLRTTALAVAA